MTLLVGLTGGIGSGKSTVCALFAELGVPIIDADAIAREIVRPGTPALEEIAGAFGKAALAEDGTLKREVLRATVFGDPGRRRELEGILHPRIRAEIDRRLRRIDSPYCVVCVPLLFEAGWREVVDRALVVDAPPPLQIARTTARDGLTAAAVEAIMRAQAPREARLAQADDVITNDGDLAQLRARVAILHDQYSRVARDSHGTGKKQ